MAKTRGVVILDKHLNETINERLALLINYAKC